MAGDWIKMRVNLWDDPRVARICDATDKPEAMVIGSLYWLWATADQHTEDGILSGLTLRAIDRKTGIPGFGQALCDVKWLADHSDGVRIVGFEQHNGASAKKRCQTAKRVASFKAGNAQETQDAKDGNADSVTKVLAQRDLDTDIEKKEKKSKTNTPRKRGAAAQLVSVEALVVDGVAEQHASEWLAIRKVKSLPLTPTAWDDTKAEAAAAGLQPAEAVRRCVVEGWAGFRASWLQNSAQRRPGKPSEQDIAAANAAANAEALRLLQGGRTNPQPLELIHGNG